MPYALPKNWKLFGDPVGGRFNDFVGSDAIGAETQSEGRATDADVKRQSRLCKILDVVH